MLSLRCQFHYKDRQSAGAKIQPTSFCMLFLGSISLFQIHCLEFEFEMSPVRKFVFEVNKIESV